MLFFMKYGDVLGYGYVLCGRGIDGMGDVGWIWAEIRTVQPTPLDASFSAPPFYCLSHPLVPVPVSTKVAAWRPKWQLGDQPG